MKIKYICMALPMMVSLGQASASSITLTGTIETKKPMPDLNVTTTGDLVGFVKKYNASVADVADGCTLVATKNEAVQYTIAGQRSCHIEWDTIQGVDQSGMNLSGYPLVTGAVSQNYTVSYYSGSSQEKVIVAQGSIQHDILVPENPVVLGVSAMLNGKEVKGFSNTTYNKAVAFNNISLSFEPRNYNQHLKLDLGSIGVSECVIKQGDDKCSLSVDLKVGQTTENLQGAEVYNIAYNSENEYFDKDVHNVNYDFLWDYRPPFTKQIILNASFDGDDKIEEINGNQYTIKHGEGLIEIGSPHIALLQEDFWQPSKATISFLPNSDRNELEITKIVDGKSLFTGRTLTWNNNYALTTYGDYSYTGESLVYKFKLDSVPDGIYDLQAKVSDINNNSSDKGVGEGFVNRDKPIIKIFTDYSEMADGSPVYFLEHLLVAGYNNFREGVTIDSVLVNGMPLQTLSGKDESVKYLSSNDVLDSLVPDTEYELTVNATDMSGTKLVHSQNIAFAPVEYELKGIGENQYYDVTEFDVYLSILKGKKCAQAADESLAQLYGSRSLYSCTIDWSAYPEGLYVNEDSAGHALNGVIKKDSSEKVINYKVNYHDGEGNTINVANNSVTFNLNVPIDPELNLLPYTQIDETTFVTPLTGGDYSYSSVIGVPAAIELNVDSADDSKEADYYFWRSRPNRRDPDALQKGSAKLFAEEGDLWGKRTIDLKANYELAPEYSVEKQIDLVFVPPKRTYAFTWLTEDFGLTTDQIKIGSRVGEFIRKGQLYKYDSGIHGEWNLTLERQISRHAYEDISDPIKYDGATDEVFFNVNGGDWLGSNKLCVRADVISPVAGYSRTIRSRCVRLAVFKGEGIEGELISRRTVGRVPFKMAATYNFHTKADRESSENVNWFLSDDDGQTWELYVHERTYKSSVRFVFEETGKWLVKGVTKNRFTGVETTSNEIEVVAYDVPEINIIGPTSIYIGEYAELTIEDEVTQSTAEGEIEWSIDGGSTWTPGTNVLSLDTTKVKLYKVLARMRYDNVDAVIERSWNEDLHYLKVNAPAKPSISITGGSEVEVGGSITLKATSRKVDRTVHYEWTMPDGTTVQSGEASFVMTPNENGKNIEYREFKISAWLEGFKHETLTQRVHKVKSWQYEQPDAFMGIQTSVKYSPAYVRVTLKQDRVYSPGVENTYELDINPSEVEIVNQTDNKFDLKITGAKTHFIKGIITDNRGNSVVVNEFIEVLQPEDMEVGINIRALSNKNNREPLTAYLQATRIMPHKKDSIKSYEWMLNGVKLNVDEESPTYWSIDDLPEGIHEVTLKAETMFGQTDMETLTIEVIDNVKPECNIKFSQSTSALEFDASCHDADGNIIRYEWLINDSIISINERVNYFKNPHLTDVDSVSVTLRVYDDSYEFSEFINTYSVTHD